MPGNMTHDPLCESQCNWSWCDCDCDCELIARVRADERKRAAAGGER